MLVLAGIGAFATVKGVTGHALSAASPARSTGLHVESALGPSTRADSPALRPPRGSAPSAASRPDESPEPNRPAAITEDGKVILNLATLDDLQRLPGVGRKRAEAIVALREKLGGRLRRFTDLLRIRGIGPRRLKQLTPLMLLDPPAVPSASASSAAGGTKAAPAAQKPMESQNSQ